MGTLWTSGFSNNTDVFVKPLFIQSLRNFPQHTNPRPPTKAMPRLQGEDPISNQDLARDKVQLPTASPGKVSLKTPGLQPSCLPSSSSARTGEKNRALAEQGPSGATIRESLLDTKEGSPTPEVFASEQVHLIQPTPYFTIS